MATDLGYMFLTISLLGGCATSSHGFGPMELAHARRSFGCKLFIMAMIKAPKSALDFGMHGCAVGSVACAPELNPAEGVWNYLRRVALGRSLLS